VGTEEGETSTKSREIDMNIFQFFITCKRTNNTNNANHDMKLGNKRQESSKHSYYIVSPRVTIRSIIVIVW